MTLYFRATQSFKAFTAPLHPVSDGRQRIFVVQYPGIQTVLVVTSERGTVREAWFGPMTGDI